MRGGCKTRDEITKHRDHSYCSFPFRQDLALVRSSELTLLRSEVPCLPQKTSRAQAVAAQASMECLNKSSSSFTQRDVPQEGSILAACHHFALSKHLQPKDVKGLFIFFHITLNDVPSTWKRFTDLRRQGSQVLVFLFVCLFAFPESEAHTSFYCRLCLLSAST